MKTQSCNSCEYYQVCPFNENCEFYTPISDVLYFQRIERPEYDAIVAEDAEEYELCLDYD